MFCATTRCHLMESSCSLETETTNLGRLGLCHSNFSKLHYQPSSIMNIKNVTFKKH